MHTKKIAAACVALALVAGNASAQTEIQWWHSMGGALGEAVNDLATKFNASQGEYKVVPVFKGSYPVSMTAAIAAFRAGNAPHVLQVFEVGTATMMAAKGAIVPVAKLMADAKEPFDPKAYLPTVAGYYTDMKGNMLSFPFNSSTVMFYINKDAFKKAGLDPERAPRTWQEVLSAGEKLKAAGQECVYTTSWPSWMHIENFSAWHNVSSAVGGIKKAAKFGWSMNFIPYHDDVKGAPQNSIIGGASLWVMGGKKPAEYRGVAKFFAFLSRPEVQMGWHVRTGYVPITQAAYELTRKSGFYEKDPGAELVVKQLTHKVPTANSKGLRFGNFVQGREVIEEELEAAFAGRKAPKVALDDAVKRGNEVLRRFEAANK
jgi:sn-glycerol 3-phosphate transport system substrate-binding protein